MTKRMAVLALMFGLALSLAPSSVWAHPHVLIDSHLVFLFEKNQVVGLQIGWKFDPVYSATLAQDYDSDKDGALSPAEIADIEKNAFSDTEDLSYFTHARIDGKPVKWPKPTGFMVFIHDKALVYAFRLSFPKPVDPRKQKLDVSVYEDSFYVDIAFPNDAAIVVSGEGAQGCSVPIAEDKSNPLLGGAVFPQKVDLMCKQP